MTNSRLKICVIGAGASGLPCIKALAYAQKQSRGQAAARGTTDTALDFDCFEASDQVGGNWCIRNRNGMSSAYDSLHINTSRPQMEYADLPMPADYPDFAGHRLIKAYFDNYVDHFGLRQHITFNTRVERASMVGTTWQVELDDGRQQTYDALLVANGHHWDPRWPEPELLAGFSGHTMHSHQYLNPHDPIDLSGQRVLVIGAGNSAMDIACELARPGLTEQVMVSSRSPTWVIPRYLFGRPLDQLWLPPRWLPWQLRSWFAATALQLAVGTPDRYGMPRPEHRLLASHPTVSGEFLGKLGSGDLHWKPQIERCQGPTVYFTDGSKQQFDTIIACTGYNVSFPFLADDVTPTKDNDLPLWLRLLTPNRRNLFFIGLLQPLGAIMPLAEQQAKLVTAYLTGDIALPGIALMQAEMEREREAMFKRYRAAARHTMQVDFADYQHKIKRVMDRGRRQTSANSETFSQWQAIAAAATRSTGPL